MMDEVVADSRKFAGRVKTRSRVQGPSPAQIAAYHEHLKRIAVASYHQSRSMARRP